MRAVAGERIDQAVLVASTLDSSLVPELFQRLGGPIEPTGRSEDPRRIIECIHAVAHASARRHPDAFISGLRSGVISRDFMALSALAALGRRDGADMLVDALDSPSWLLRKEAIHGLDQLGAGEALRPHLERLLADKHGSVAFSAVRAMIRWGEPGNIPALQAFRVAAPRGANELALDAMEAICSRAGLPLPGGHPGPRLETVDLALAGLARAARIVALATPPQQVRAGRAIARVISADGAEWEVEAPCDGIVVRLDLDLGQAVIERRPARSTSSR